MKEQLIIFEENKVKVRERLKDGRIDYFDLTSWSFQDRLFGFLMEGGFLSGVPAAIRRPGNGRTFRFGFYWPVGFR